MSDSQGCIYNPKGLDIDAIKEIKEINRQSIESYLRYDSNATYSNNAKKLYEYPCDIALPCATQNELDQASAHHLISNGVILVAEGANMPATKEAIALFKKHKVVFAPGKAANAGGVLVSGIEISQNKQFYNYTFDRVDEILSHTMRKIFHDIYNTSKQFNKNNDLQFGANIQSFLIIAKAMYEQGVV